MFFLLKNGIIWIPVMTLTGPFGAKLIWISGGTRKMRSVPWNPTWSLYVPLKGHLIFVAFLPGTGEEEARKMIREMKQSALTYQVMGHPLSVSFGSSTILTKEDSVTDCLKCSDKRMYRDKREKKAAR